MFSFFKFYYHLARRSPKAYNYVLDHYSLNTLIILFTPLFVSMLGMVVMAFVNPLFILFSLFTGIGITFINLAVVIGVSNKERELRREQEDIREEAERAKRRKEAGDRYREYAEKETERMRREYRSGEYARRAREEAEKRKRQQQEWKRKAEEYNRQYREDWERRKRRQEEEEEQRRRYYSHDYGSRFDWDDWEARFRENMRREKEQREQQNRQQQYRQQYERTNGDRQRSNGGQQRRTYSGGSSDTLAKSLKVLGLSQGCTKQEAKSAYRKLAKKHHPDTGGDAEKFKLVKKAYDYVIARL